MSSIWVPPAFIVIFSILLLPVLKKREHKNIYLLIIPAIALVNVILMTKGNHFDFSFLGYKIVLARVDKLSKVFAYIFVIAIFVGTLYSIHLKQKRENVAAFLYAGSALGVVFAGDFFSLFVFWEIMAIASTYLIWARGTKASASAGFRYIVVHLLGGLILFSGIVLHVANTGSIAFNHIGMGEGLASWLILLGFGLNAAIPPLSAWLSDAYPEATVAGTVFLSAFTTKTAVYVLIRGFSEVHFLAYVGAIMAFYGVVYAVLANDIRRILAYHIISQVGFMVAAVGIGTDLAINGAVAHAFAHILYKGLLFMGAGVVLKETGESRLSELGGLYKYMPITFALYMIGAFSISGFPFFSGFVSKSMEISAAGEEKILFVWFILTLSSAGTFLSTGLKLPYFTWLGKDSGLKGQEPPKNMLAAMGVASALCVLIGLAPSLLYNLLPYPVEYHPYSAAHLIETIQYLFFTAVGFFLLLKYLAGHLYVILDTDWFYRKTAPMFRSIAEGFSTFNNWAEAKIERVPYYLSLTKKPMNAFTNFLSDTLFVIWCDFWLFKPVGKLGAETADEPSLEKNLIFKPFYWLARFMDSLSERMSKAASTFDHNVVDKTAEGLANVMFSQKEIIGGHKVSSFANMFDKFIVDGLVNGVARIVFYFGEKARKMQTGFVQSYALIIVVAIAFMIFALSIKGGFK